MELRDFEAATVYYQKALNFREESEDFYKAAGLYHNLGRIAQLQRRFEEAIDYSQKALKIYENVGDVYKAADEYHQLGEVAQEQRRYEEAITYSQKALKIYENAGDLNNAAVEYHLLEHRFSNQPPRAAICFSACATILAMTWRLLTTAVRRRSNRFLREPW